MLMDPIAVANWTFGILIGYFLLLLLIVCVFAYLRRNKD